jgi:hypothetical protein
VDPLAVADEHVLDLQPAELAPGREEAQRGVHREALAGGPVNRIDHPDPSAGRERMRGSPKRRRLRGDLSETQVDLVAEAELHV